MMKEILLYIPFLVVLLSLSLLPLVAARFWHKYMVCYLLVIACISVVCDLIFLDVDQFKHLIHHALLHEYIPFICTISSLYIISCNININIQMSDTTRNNSILLFIGGCLSSIIGTTGASMLLAKPFIKINENRGNIAYMMVFFIVIVSNIGGLLTPLGDPPLFVGYLNGVSFFWVTKNLFLTWLLYIVFILFIFYVYDKIYIVKHNYTHRNTQTSIAISGSHNFFLLAVIIVSIFVKNQVVKNVIVLASGLTSILMAKFINKSNSNLSNKIEYGPIKEVILAFLAIFITIAPVMLLLYNNQEYISSIVRSISQYVSLPNIYYWMCGLVSSVLDNAPSYLLFFNIAGDAESLMMSKHILVAISSGAVVMGSLTYIGNAPNMLVKSIAQSMGVKMHGFFSYIFIACAIVIPSAFCINYIINTCT